MFQVQNNSSLALHNFQLKSDGLYAFGKNSSGQLGLGHNKWRIGTPTKTNFNPQNVLKIACGNVHTLVLCKDALYSFGNNEYGQLGLGHRASQKTPQVVPISSKYVVDIACGFHHTYVLCHNGLFVFGRNTSGQLGLGHTQCVVLPERTNFNPQSVSLIACGGFHSFILTREGLYACGSNRSHQLSLDHEEEWEPAKTAFKSELVVSIACGFQHTLILCKDGLYAFGNNEYGQLGSTFVFQSTPHKIIYKGLTLTSSNVISIACGCNHNVVLLNDNEVCGFGSNRFSQLRRFTNSYSHSSPIKLNGIKILAIQCGSDHTFMHSGKDIDCLGYNMYGELNTTDIFSELIEKKNNQIGDNEKRFREYMIYLLNTGAHSDIKILNKNLHKSLLDARFPGLVTHASYLNQIISLSTFDQLIYWIYTNTIDNISIKAIVEILKVVKVTNSNLILHYLVNQTNAIEILNYAIKLDLREIRIWLLSYMGSKRLTLPVNVYTELSPNETHAFVEELLASQTLHFKNSFQSLSDLHYELSRDTKYTDCSILYNNKTVIYLHKFVITRWKYFEAILIKSKAINTQIPLSSLRKIIEYFYVGLEYISLYDAGWILAFADEYLLTEEEKLISLCDEVINSNINLHNCLGALNLACDIQHEELKKKVIETMFNQMNINDSIGIMDEFVTYKKVRIREEFMSLEKSTYRLAQKMRVIKKELETLKQEINK